MELILKLVSSYTDCIDYFGNLADNVVVYFQAKIKDVNKYYEFFRNISTITPATAATHHQIPAETDPVKELGAIWEPAGAGLLPAEEREPHAKGKEALTQNLMACLQTQDITSHIKEKMKQVEKIHTTISNSLQEQEDRLTRRKHKRKLNKSCVSQSFSEHTTFQSEFNRSNEENVEMSQTSEMIEIDLEALDCEIDNADKLKELLEIKRMRRLMAQVEMEGGGVEGGAEGELGVGSAEQ